MLPKRGIMAIYSADDDDPVERGWPEFPSRCFQGSPPLSGPSTGKSLTGSFQCAGGRLIMEYRSRSTIMRGSLRSRLSRRVPSSCSLAFALKTFQMTSGQK